MAQRTLKKLQYDGSDVVVEVANRDGNGNVITSTYATQSALTTGLAAKQNTLTAGTGITINSSTVALQTASASQLGGIKLGTGLTITNEGVVSVTSALWSGIQNKPFVSISKTGDDRDFTVSDDESRLYINGDKWATKAHVADTYVSKTLYENFINYTLPTNYQTKITTSNKISYDCISGVPTKLSQFSNTETGFITKAVTNLENYYKKTETYTQAEVNALVEAINSFDIVILSSGINLPTAGAGYKNKLYFKEEQQSTDNYYSEWVCINDSGLDPVVEGWHWEKIGSTKVDLANYLNSSSNIANNVIVIGDGGSSRKVKGSGYTIATSISNSDTSVPRNSAVYSALAGKQATLTAGNGITISSNTIASVITATDVTLNY